MNRKSAAAIAGILFAAANASAQVLYEPFDYANTSKLTTNPSSGSSYTTYTGQTLPTQGTTWSRTAGNTIVSRNWAVSTVAGNLLSDPNIPDSRGGSVLSPTSGNSGTEVDRMSVGEEITSGTLYYSFALRVNSTTGITTGGLRVIGLNSFTNAAGSEASIFGASTVIASPSANNWQLGVSKNSGTGGTFTIDTANTYSTGQTVYVVGSYTIVTPSSVGSDDESRLWVNPTGTDFGAAAAPATTIAGLPNTATNDLGDGNPTPDTPLPQLASFFLRSPNLNLNWTLDELRIDSTWAGVTPRKDLQYTWNSGTGGTFNDSTWTTTNGTQTKPNSLGAVANFGSGIASGNITSGGQTIDTIDIDDTNSLTINGTGLTISTNASAGQIIVHRGNHTVSAPLTLSSNLALKAASGSTLTLSGAVTGSSKKISVYGSGTVKMGGNNLIDNSSTLNVRTGTLDLNGNNVTVDVVGLGAASRNNGTAANGSSTGGPTAAFGTITGAGTLTANTFNLEAGTIGSNIAGTTLTKLNGGTVTLSGSNAITGTMTVRDGTLIAGSNGALSGAASQVVLIDSGSTAAGVTLEANSGVTVSRDLLVNAIASAPTATVGGATSGTSTFSGGLTMNRTTRLIAQPNGTASFTGAISEGTSSGIQKVGSGMVVLSGTNTYSGNSDVLAGTLLATSPGSLPNYSMPGKVTVSTVAGSTLAVSAGAISGQWAGPQIDSVLANASIAATMNFGINVDTGNTFNYGSNITPANSIGFVKLGAGELELSGANTYAGGTQVLGGTLKFTTSNNLGAVPSTITVSNGATLKSLAGVNPDNGGGANVRLLVMGTGGGVLDDNGVNMPDMQSSINGSGSFTKAGSGTLVTGFANNFNGLVARGGVFEFINDANLGVNTGSITFDGGTMRPRTDFQVNGSRGTFNVTSNGGTWDMNNKNVDAAANPVEGSGNFRTVAGGSLIVKRVRTGGLEVNNTGTLIIAFNGVNGPHPPGNTGDNSTSKVNKLTLAGTTDAWTSTLDLVDNDLVIQSDAVNAAADYATAYNQVKTALYGNGGPWTGTGITSSKAAANTDLLYAVGIISNNDAQFGGLGDPLYATFSGQTADANAILIKSTYFGDANLDGTIDITDYGLIDTAFNNQTVDGGWVNGDFDYSGGTIDISDYGLIDGAFGNQMLYMDGYLTPGLAGVSAVPEPASLGLLGIGAAGLLGKRRRRRN